VFRTHCYHVPLRFTRKPRVVVDLGANVGLTTLYLHRAYGPATYVCVEPSTANFDLLEKNVGTLPSVHLLNGAVSDLPGTARFNPGKWSWGGQLEQDSSSGYDVRCYAMEEIIDILNIDRIDLLKVDIENGVARLFGNNNGWLARADVVIAELYDDYPIDRFAADLARFGLQALAPSSRYGNKMILGVRTERLGVE
jgi:FkbM family methyltransferase